MNAVANHLTEHGHIVQVWQSGKYDQFLRIERYDIELENGCLVLREHITKHKTSIPLTDPESINILDKIVGYW